MDKSKDSLQIKINIVPKYLYKYRPFDEYSIDMLENNYLFLCKANNLDDETECDVSFDMTEYGDVKNDIVSKKMIDDMFKQLQQYLPKSDELEANIYSLVNDKQELKLSDFWDFMGNMKESKQNGLDAEYWKNLVEKLKSFFCKPEAEKIKPLVELAYYAKEKIGICSLSQNYNDLEMWENYANKSKGYCIEYDMQEFEDLNKLYPVKYVLPKDRNSNLIMQLSFTFIDYFIKNITGIKIDNKVNGYVSLFCTKYKKWSYQNEWRILGGANSKITAPKINRIIIGKDATKETIDKLSTIGKLYNIKIVKNN